MTLQELEKLEHKFIIDLDDCEYTAAYFYYGFAVAKMFVEGGKINE